MPSGCRRASAYTPTAKSEANHSTAQLQSLLFPFPLETSVLRGTSDSILLLGTLGFNVTVREWRMRLRLPAPGHKGHLPVSAPSQLSRMRTP